MLQNALQMLQKGENALQILKKGESALQMLHEGQTADIGLFKFPFRKLYPFPKIILNAPLWGHEPMESLSS